MYFKANLHLSFVFRRRKNDLLSFLHFMEKDGFSFLFQMEIRKQVDHFKFCGKALGCKLILANLKS